MTSDLSALTSPSPAWTQDFEFVRGEYKMSGEKVPYFAIAMTVSDSFKYLSLARELALNEDEPVNVEELMQREIDETRSGEEIVAYLKQPGRIKFFNSLTVVLMPIKPSGRPSKTFNESPSEAPDATDEALKPSQVGQVLIRQLPGSSFGFLRWHANATKAVIIDGQHRFLALKKFTAEYPGVLNSDETRLPILVLVLDARAGYQPPHDGPVELIKASRAIFTDINKHAKKVTSERQYLLDDQSLQAVSLRAIITPGIGRTQLSPTATPDRLPLSLIDWNREGATKFDDGPFVTTLQSMYQLTGELLAYGQPPNTAYRYLATWINTLTERLEISDPAWKKSEIDQRLQQAEEEEVPFSLTDREIGAAADAFRGTVGQVIVHSIARMAPYRDLAQRYSEEGFLGGRREFWLGQTAAGRKAYEMEFDDRPEADLKALAESVKLEYSHAFQVVFQRGFVVAAKLIDSHRVQMAEAWGLAADSSRVAVLDHWIDLFNAKFGAQISQSETDLWLGTAVGLDRRIDYKTMSKNAIMGLCLLATTADLELDESPVNKRTVIAALQGTSATYRLIDKDKLQLPAVTDADVAAAGRWSAALATLRTGPAPRDAAPARSLIKEAAKHYREGVRRYVEQLATQAGRDLSEEERDLLVHAHGARRLAYLARGTNEHLAAQ